MMTKRMMFAAIACTLMHVLVIADPVRSALGARLAYADAKVPSYTVADYVQDGLCAIWDGIDNAGVGIHDDTLTQWMDLIGECPLIWDVSKCTWEENAIANWSDTLARSTYPIRGANHDWWEGIGVWSSLSNRYFWCVGDFSIEIVLRIASNSVVCTPFNPYYAYNVLGYTVNNPWSSWRIIFSPANDWHGGGRYAGLLLREMFGMPISVSGVARVNGTSIMYANGDIQVSSLKTYQGTMMYDAYSSILDVPVNGGAIYCLRIYNRALDEHEVVHNYRVDKVRFGL